MRLLNINIGIKINNTEQISRFIIEQNADFVAIQEIVRHLEKSVYKQYQSKTELESKVNYLYPYNFFGPLWITNAFLKNGQVHRDFGGLIEQGNEILSKYAITEATNEHFYKSYSYAIDWTNWQNEDHGRAVIVSKHNVNGRILKILNLHGIWTKDKKGDSRTVKQCKYILERDIEDDIPTIITGDFNLVPESDSLEILNKMFRNLISEYKIKSTRPDFKDNVDVGLNVVDYIFVNNRIKVNEFKVIECDISDHLPLILDFDII